MSVNALNMITIGRSSNQVNEDIDDDDDLEGEGSTIIEGYLVRKHCMENRIKQATNRSWKNIFAIVRGSILFMYKPFTNSRKVNHHLNFNKLTDI